MTGRCEIAQSLQHEQNPGERRITYLELFSFTLDADYRTRRLPTKKREFCKMIIVKYIND